MVITNPSLKKHDVSYQYCSLSVSNDPFQPVGTQPVQSFPTRNRYLHVKICLHIYFFTLENRWSTVINVYIFHPLKRLLYLMALNY